MKEPVFIEEFFPEQVCNIAYNYTILKSLNKRNFVIDRQTESIFSEYSDFLMETLLELSTPVVESNVGKKLFPTYSFLRIYDKGSDLKIHLDRASCEYTVAICLGSDPISPYSLFVGRKDEQSKYKFFDQESKKLIPMQVDFEFPMKQNNALIFNGIDNYHWREECSHDNYATVFLHYVDQNGKNKDFIFDKRECLGCPK